jgi:hypothetical protein
VVVVAIVMTHQIRTTAVFSASEFIHSVIIPLEREKKLNRDPLDSPERLPVKLGVHRIFTLPTYRGCGIVRSLLDEACRHTIYGYKVGPDLCIPISSHQAGSLMSPASYDTSV